MTVIAMTGHRPASLGWGYDYTSENWTWLARELDDLFRLAQPSEVISGMALGVDTVAAIVALNRRIPLHAAIPHDGQETRWKKDGKDLYHRVLQVASKRTVVSPGGYAAWKMQRRNEFMVDNCDVLIAVWNGEKGGTGNCVKYARKIGRPIVYINPETREIRAVESLSVKSLADEEI